MSTLAGLSVAAALYQTATARQQSYFSHLASTQVARLTYTTGVVLRPVEYVAAVFEFEGGAVSADGFQLLAQSIPSAKQPALVALQWLPRESDASGQVHFPVRYSYGPAGGGGALGTKGVTGPLLARAISAQKLVVSHWYLAAGQVRVLGLRPVFTNRPGESPTLLGFVAGVYRLDRLLENAWAESPPALVDLWVSDGAAGLPGALQYTQGSVRYGVVVPAAPPELRLRIERIDVAGSEWSIRVFARPGAFVTNPWPPLLIALGGLSLGGLLALYLRDLQARERRVRELVVQRTDELYRRQQEFEALAEHAPDHVARYDSELRYLYVNPAMAAVTGIPREAFLGKTDRELGFPEALVTDWESHQRRVFANGWEEKVEFTFPTPEGERYFESRLVPEFGPDGRVSTVLAVTRDLTERKRLENDLRQRGELIQTILDNIPVMITLYDLSGPIEFANRALLQMTGWSAEELPQIDLVAEVFPNPAYRQEVLEYMQQARQEWRDFRMRTRSGGYIDSAWSNVRLSGGRRIGIGINVSERKRAEEALRASEQKYRTLVENLYEGIWLIDAEGVTTFVNARMAELLGYEVEEMLGKAVFVFMDPQAAEAARANLARGRTGQKIDYEFAFSRKDGTSVFTRIATAPLFDEKDRYCGALAAVVDLTERKRMEDALRRVNAELQQFAYVASHDLRAPLRAVSNLSSWLENDLGPQLSGESAGHLHLLRERVQLMDAFIQDLLAYSRAGGETRQVEQVDSAALVQEVLSTQEVPEEFHIQIAEPMPQLVTDRTKLQQVFANLLGNALKYHDRPDGHIRVSTREAGDFYEFSVADDGPGIAAEYQSSIFQMFQRGPTAQEGRGTGIGLAVVKKLVEGVGGTVDLESAPGQGSTFRFTWPKHMEARTEH